MVNAYGFNFIKIGGIWIFWGAETPIRGRYIGLWCPFSNSDELFQSKVMCKNSVWIGWNQRYVNSEGVGGSPLLWGGGVTCDLWCPSSNLAELFQSKVICENLVRIVWAFLELSCPQTNKQTYKQTHKHTNIKKITDATENKILQGKIFFRADNNNNKRHVQQWYLAMASARETQERNRRDDNGCTRPSTKNKIHSKSHWWN